MNIWDLFSYTLSSPFIVGYIIFDRLSFKLAILGIFPTSKLRSKVYYAIQPPRDFCRGILEWCIRDEADKKRVPSEYINKH